MIGKNITEVAEAAGIDRTTISKAELGFQDPRLGVLVKWASALGFKLVLEDVEDSETTPG
jgi:DNA-binding phage protein